jgi:copper homeostasis protein
MKRLLEVIACSVEDAEAAEQGGAGRLEVVRELGRGGCTPELALVRAILDRVSIPVRVMLRESDGFAYAGREEISRMCAFARHCRWMAWSSASRRKARSTSAPALNCCTPHRY